MVPPSEPPASDTLPAGATTPLDEPTPAAPTLDAPLALVTPATTAVPEPAVPVAAAAGPAFIEAPYGVGSARSLPDGSPPGPDYTIKANVSSKLFHPPSSPYYKRTKAQVWFRTADDARAAGFTEWSPRKRTKG